MLTMCRPICPSAFFGVLCRTIIIIIIIIDIINIITQ